MATIVHSIGSAAGRDFSTVAAWISSLPSDLVADGNSYVGELYADSELTFSGTLTFSGNTDAAHNITLRAAAGQGWRDNANVQTNPFAYNPANGVALKNTDSYVSTGVFVVNAAYTLIQGIQLHCTGYHGRSISTNAAGVVIEDVILKVNDFDMYLRQGSILRNSLVYQSVAAKAVNNDYSTSTYENSTFFGAPGNTNAFTGGVAGLTLKNVAFFNYSSLSDRSAANTFDHCASDQTLPSGSGNLSGLVASSQFVSTTAGSEDFRLLSSSALRNAGATLSDVTDAANNLPRPQGSAYDIGAWEFQEATIVVPTFSSAVADNLSGGGVYVVFSNPLYDWTQASPLHAAPPSSAFTVTGSLSGAHTFTGVVSDVAEGRIRLAGVSPFFKVGETVTVAYTAPTDGSGLYDATGATAVASFAAQSVANNVQVTAPDAPTIGTAQAGNGYVDVYFTAPAYDGDAAITGYTATLSTGQTGSGTTSPIRVSAPNGTAVTATVTATNSAGTSPSSAPSNAVTPTNVVVAPATPTNVQATAGAAGSGQASISFTPGSNGGASPTYHVTSSPGGLTADGSASPITVAGLTAGTAYTFTVTASNSAGTSAASAASNSITVAAAPVLPGAPTITGVTAGDGALTVAFTAPASDGGTGITSYVATAGTQQATGPASPLTITGLSDGTAYAVTVAAVNSVGTGPASASMSGTPTAPTVDGMTFPAGSLVKTIGTGKDFANMGAFANWVGGQNPAALGGSIYGIVYEAQNLDGLWLTCAGGVLSDAQHVIVQPAAGMGIASSGPLRFGTEGIHLNISSSTCVILRGFEFRDFYIDFSGTATLSAGAIQTMNYGSSTTGYDVKFTDCVIRSSNPNSALMQLGFNSVNTRFDNCLLFQTGGGAVNMFKEVQSTQIFRSCGFVRLGNYTVPLVDDAGFFNIENSFFIGCGSQLSGTNNGWGRSDHNITDTAITTGVASGFTVATGLVVDASSDQGDFTPVANGPLIGAANADAVSTNDLRGNNHGLAPDVGPLQQSPALPLPKATITNQPPMDGQTFSLSGTYSGTVDSASLTLNPDANNPNGAQSLGPVAITFANGAWSVSVDSVSSGNYAVPQAMFINAGGATVALGGAAFSVAGVAAAIMDTGAGETTAGTGGGTPPAAPTISISTANAAVLMGQRATLSGAVNLQGDATGTVALFLDLAGGTPSTQPILAANIANGIWSAQTGLTALAPGQWVLRAVATANGQTASASTGTLTVVGLTGSVAQLPNP